MASSTVSATSTNGDERHLRRGRAASLAIAVVTFIFLTMRIYLSSARWGGIIAAISFLSHFFTVLTNVAVALTMGISAGSTNGNIVPPSIWLALVAAILGVSIVYHGALRHLITLPPGMARVADEGVHTVVPLLTFGWWMVFEHRPVDVWNGAISCIVGPMAYGVYILLRAQLWGGIYPYPFLNLPEIGTVQFIINCVGLGVVFAGLGVGLLAMKRTVNKTRKTTKKE